MSTAAFWSFYYFILPPHSHLRRKINPTHSQCCSCSHRDFLEGDSRPQQEHGRQQGTGGERHAETQEGAKPLHSWENEACGSFSSICSCSLVSVLEVCVHLARISSGAVVLSVASCHTGFCHLHLWDVTVGVWWDCPLNATQCAVFLDVFVKSGICGGLVLIISIRDPFLDLSRKGITF